MGQMKNKRLIGPTGPIKAKWAVWPKHTNSTRKGQMAKKGQYGQKDLLGRLAKKAQMAQNIGRKDQKKSKWQKRMDQTDQMGQLSKTGHLAQNAHLGQVGPIWTKQAKPNCLTGLKEPHRPTGLKQQTDQLA